MVSPRGGSDLEGALQRGAGGHGRRKAHAVEPVELIATANEKLARYKRIEQCEFIAAADLPRNAMNKVLKRELTALADAVATTA